MTRASLIQLALIAALSSAASAQSPASRQEQIDCRPDAMKLCASHIGKSDEMRACLAQNKARLSDACRKVVEARGG
jgi:ABC-type Fe3+-citrate transport system substrate-binding protein